MILQYSFVTLNFAGWSLGAISVCGTADDDDQVYIRHNMIDINVENTGNFQ